MTHRSDTDRRTVLPFRKLSFDSLRRKIPFETVDPEKYYSSSEKNDEECVVMNVPSPDTAMQKDGTVIVSSQVDLVADTGETSTQSIKAVMSPTHARSRSDGYRSIQRDATASLSTHSHYGTQNCIYSQSADNSYNPSPRFYDQEGFTGDHSDEDHGSFIYHNQFANDTELDQDNESCGQISPANSSFGSRFPRPKPGESLVSFLSSADLYKNCGVLDRENAHFYISEALMAAFEQMRFEAECRAVGLLEEDFGDESDEEIKSLQDQIRQRRQQKLGWWGVSGGGNSRESAVPSTAATLASQPSASTTDYSVYESPLSSAHTESSDPFSDSDYLTGHTHGSCGVRHSRAPVAGSTRTRRKTLKRSSRRFSRGDAEVAVRQYCDTSDAAGHDSGADSAGSSCCTISNLDGREGGDTAHSETVTLEGGELGASDSAGDATIQGVSCTTSQVSPDDCIQCQQNRDVILSARSDEGRHGISPREELYHHNKYHCHELSHHDQSNSIATYSHLPNSVSSHAPQFTNLVDAVDGRSNFPSPVPSIGSSVSGPASVEVETSSSSGKVRHCPAPQRVPDPRSAESIGLRLLQHLAAPQHQLPKASELQWLVSERDAPQKLLPLPGAAYRLPNEPVLLRGTPDWAPPREQLILTLVPEKKRSTVLSSQNYRCAGCGQQVNPSLSKHYRLCYYFMRYFCATCHMNQALTIPAKVLHQWDIKQYPVSCFAHQLLTRLYNEPLYYPVAINASLYSASRNLNQFRVYRQQLYYCLTYINTCNRTASERKIIRETCPAHWCCDGEVVSLRELVGVKSGAGGSDKTGTAACGVLNVLQTLTKMSLDHVSKCQACQGRGFICEVCRDDVAIFPFELATVRVCEACGACTHYRCVLKHCGRCSVRRKRHHRTAAARGEETVMLTSEQKTWIILEYGKTSSPEALKEKFVQRFNIEGREKTKYQPHIFDSVVEILMKNRITQVL